jgi:hypothetical protein
VLEESISTLSTLQPVVKLLRKIAVSTHALPQYYKLDRIRYDPSSIAKGTFGKVYKGSNFDVYVNVVTDSNSVSVRSVQSISQT